MAARTDLALDFGGATRREIQAALAAAGVLMNEFATRLMALSAAHDALLQNSWAHEEGG